MHRTQNPTASAADTDGLDAVTPADVLRGAARYLDLRGWVQHVYYGGTAADAFPPADAIGAIGMAAHGVVTDCPEMSGPNLAQLNKAADHLRWYLLDQGHLAIGPDRWNTPTDIGAWNDLDWHTVDDIATVLRSAADEYDFRYATQDDLETYAGACASNEEHPTREGFLAWLRAR
ncbi:DUF6197 family protein [Actinoplanes sp. NPDC004185]